MHLLVLLPLQCPAMLCGATHPPGFICRAVFPLKMRYSICQEATTIVFLQKQKKKKMTFTIFCTTRVLGMDSSHTRTNTATNPRVWTLSPKILPCCGFPQHWKSLKNISRNLLAFGSQDCFHFLVADVLSTYVRVLGLGGKDVSFIKSYCRLWYQSQFQIMSHNRR